MILGGCLGACWGRLGAFWGRLGAALGRLGAFWAHLLWFALRVFGWFWMDWMDF